MRKTGRSRPSELESRPRWGVTEDRRSTSPARSSTLPRMLGKKNRAPAPPPPTGNSSAKVGRSVIATGMATFHHPRRKFHIPCKGRSVLSAEDDEVYILYYHHHDPSLFAFKRKRVFASSLFRERPVFFSPFSSCVSLQFVRLGQARHSLSLINSKLPSASSKW